MINAKLLLRGLILPAVICIDLTFLEQFLRFVLVRLALVEAPHRGLALASTYEPFARVHRKRTHIISPHDHRVHIP